MCAGNINCREIYYFASLFPVFTSFIIRGPCNRLLSQKSFDSFIYIGKKGNVIFHRKLTVLSKYEFCPVVIGKMAKMILPHLFHAENTT